MSYKNILFDLDGTLTDSSEGIIKCVLHTYEKMGVTPPAEELLTTFIGPPLSDSFARCGIKEENIRLYSGIYHVDRSHRASDRLRRYLPDRNGTAVFEHG